MPPIRTRAIDFRPVVNTPVQTSPVQTTPVQTRQVQTTPVQTTPVRTRGIDFNPPNGGNSGQLFGQRLAGIRNREQFENAGAQAASLNAFSPSVRGSVDNFNQRRTQLGLNQARNQTVLSAQLTNQFAQTAIDEQRAADARIRDLATLALRSDENELRRMSALANIESDKQNQLLRERGLDIGEREGEQLADFRNRSLEQEQAEFEQRQAFEQEKFERVFGEGGLEEQRIQSRGDSAEAKAAAEQFEAGRERFVSNARRGARTTGAFDAFRDPRTRSLDREALQDFEAEAGELFESEEFRNADREEVALEAMSRIGIALKPEQLNKLNEFRLSRAQPNKNVFAPGNQANTPSVEPGVQTPNFPSFNEAGQLLRQLDPGMTDLEIHDIIKGAQMEGIGIEEALQRVQDRLRGVI